MKDKTHTNLIVVTNTLTGQISKFTYDGDGARVLQIQISGTQVIATAYAGPLEVQITATQRITKTYYNAGSQSIAMRVYTSPTGSVLYFLHSDHLGSTSLTTNASGGVVARQLYDAWGNVRYVTGTLPTDVAFTGQRSDSTGLMNYGARYYSAVVGRFVSADTLVPDGKNPQQFNRYTYGLNNPVKYTDPTGHRVDEGCTTTGCSATQSDIDQAIGNAERAKSSQFYRDCAQGGGTGCPKVGELAAFAAAGFTAMAAPELIGAGVEAIEALGVRAAVACANTPVCFAMVAGGGAKATSDAASARGQAAVEAGRVGEEAVSDAIGVARNIGPGRATIPGTGPGGFRVPDFDPDITIPLRGSIVEVKNVQSLSITPQPRDLAAYAQQNNAVLEIFTNAPAPTRGVLFQLIQRGQIVLRSIP